MESRVEKGKTERSKCDEKIVIESEDESTEKEVTDSVRFPKCVPSTPATQLRGSLRGRYYGNIGTRVAPSVKPGPVIDLVTSPPRRSSVNLASPPSPLLVPPQNQGLALSLHIPLWEDPDSATIRWENKLSDSIPTQVLGQRSHLFLKRRDRSGIRVIMRKEGTVVDFEAPPFLNSPIPRLTFGDLRHLFAPVICVQFVLAGQFVDAGKMVAVHVDFRSRHNFVSQGLLPRREDCEHTQIDARTVPFYFDDFKQTRVDYEIPLVVRGREAFLITKERVRHFPFQRLILGTEFLERHAVSMHGTLDRGEIYFEDTEKRVYAQSYQKKRGE